MALAGRIKLKTPREISGDTKSHAPITWLLHHGHAFAPNVFFCGSSWGKIITQFNNLIWFQIIDFVIIKSTSNRLRLANAVSLGKLEALRNYLETNFKMVLKKQNKAQQHF